MFANLVNKATQDRYDEALTVRLPGAVRVFLQVANAAVIYEEDNDPEAKGLWSGERFLTPTVGSFDRRLSGIRFRSAVPGVPAQVSVELLDADELGGGADSIAPAAFTVAASGAVTPAGAGGAGVNNVRVRKTVDQALAAGASTTVIVWDAATFDNGNMWDPGLPSRLTVPAGGAGKYLVGCSLRQAAPGVPLQMPHLRANGATLITPGLGVNLAPAAGQPYQVGPLLTLWDAVVGTFFEVVFTAVAGVANSTLEASGEEVNFWAILLSPA